ncbi:MAG: MauE/DoxX family redox-associated membrane protein [Actinomycetota bacterium]
MSVAERAELASTAAVLLAVVFGWAAFAKLGDRFAATGRFRRLGLPAPGLAVRLIVAVELVTALALVTRPRIGGIVAIAVLAAFTLFLADAIRRGVQVGCGCFGQAADHPVSGRDLARNVALVAVAVIATDTTTLVRPGVEAIVLAATIVLVAAVLAGLWDLRRTTGRIWAVPEPLPEPLPEPMSEPLPEPRPEPMLVEQREGRT